MKPFSRDGARVAFKELEAIAKVEHLEGRGGTASAGSRRISQNRRRATTA